MKKLLKILPILMIVFMVFAMATPVLAVEEEEEGKASTDTHTIGDVDIKIDTSAGVKVGEIGGTILGIIQVVGTIIAVGVLMVLGIKYMMGSAEEKAEYKKTMLPYLIGAILLFAAVNLASYVVSIANTIGGVT